MRTLHLIRALSDAEIKVIERSLTGSKRQALKSAFTVCKKYAAKKEDPDRTELFEKIIGEPYAKDKDYLLRNKMRQINEIIYEYLATDAFRSSISTDQSAFNYWLAKAYHDRRLNTLIEDDIDGFLNTAIQSISPSGTNEPAYSGHLYSLKSIWLIHYDLRQAANIKAQSLLLDQWLNEEKRRFLYKIREIEARGAFLRSILGEIENTDDWHTGPGVSPATVIDLSEQERGDPLAHFLRLKKRLHETIGWQKIDLLRELLTICDQEQYSMVVGPHSKLTYKAQIARELILLGEFKAADIYLSEVIAGGDVRRSPQIMSALHNHLVNQINIGTYQKGIKIYQQYRNEIIESNHVKTFALHLSYLYLFLGRDDEAIAALPLPAGMIPLHQLHHRHAYMIAFIHRGDLDLARTESLNLKKFISRMKTPSMSYYLDIIEFFDEYIAALSAGSKEKVSVLNKLRTKIKDDFAKWNQTAIDDFPLRWLMTRLEV